MHDHDERSRQRWTIALLATATWSLLGIGGLVHTLATFIRERDVSQGWYKLGVFVCQAPATLALAIVAVALLVRHRRAKMVPIAIAATLMIQFLNYYLTAQLRDGGC